MSNRSFCIKLKENYKPMKRRIFIAVNLPEYIKKELDKYKDKWPGFPCRWTKKDNLHITLVFLGYLSDEEMLAVCDITKKIAVKQKPFVIKLNRIFCAPPCKKPPRMVWVEGEKSKEFSKLKNDLEKSVMDSEGIRFLQETRPFSPHITLARINVLEFRQVEPEEIPDINEEINLNFEVNSIDVMESELKKGGPEYIILESCQLKN